MRFHKWLSAAAGIVMLGGVMGLGASGAGPGSKALQIRRRARAGVLAAVWMILSMMPAVGKARQEQTASPADAINRYRAFLAKLPLARKESILAARDELVKYLSGEKRCGDDVGCAQGTFDRFSTFYEEAVSAAVDPLYKNRPAQEVLNELAKAREPEGGWPLERPLAPHELDRAALRRKVRAERQRALDELLAYRDCGIDFSFGEGDWYPRDDPDFVLAIAKHLPEGEYRDYVFFVTEESRQRLAEDASFMVPRDALRDRLVRWDRFIATHPNVARYKQMRKDADRLAGWFIAGIDNTPAFEHGSLALDSELKASFEKFLAVDKRCSYYSLIAGYWERLRAAKFRLNADAVSYLEKQVVGNAELQNWVDRLRRSIAP